MLGSYTVLVFQQTCYSAGTYNLKNWPVRLHREFLQPTERLWNEKQKPKFAERNRAQGLVKMLVCQECGLGFLCVGRTISAVTIHAVCLLWFQEAGSSGVKETARPCLGSGDGGAVLDASCHASSKGWMRWCCSWQTASGSMMKAWHKSERVSGEWLNLIFLRTILIRKSNKPVDYAVALGSSEKVSYSCIS